MSAGGVIGHRIVSWTVSKDIGIGQHRCEGCAERMTPEPTNKELVEFAQSHPGANYIWPGDDWMPKGWSAQRDGTLLCPDCTSAVSAALLQRRKKP